MSGGPGVVVGLTGGIGAGKSTVARLLGERGADIVDVDALGRLVLEPGGGAHAAVVSAFGEEVLGADGGIDRGALAAVVFGPDDRLAELEAASHPAINLLIEQRLVETTAPVIVLDMAVLAESRLGRRDDGSRMYQRVVVVEAPEAVRIPRLTARGMTERDARSRMVAQADDTDRRALADLIVPNGGSVDDLGSLIDALWPTFEAWASQGRRSLRAEAAGPDVPRPS